jgi:hypothetical protein
MNSIGPVTAEPLAPRQAKSYEEAFSTSSTRAANQTAANAAHAAQSAARAQLSEARAQGDPGAIKTAQRTLATATSAAIIASGALNITA